MSSRSELRPGSLAPAAKLSAGKTSVLIGRGLLAGVPLPERGALLYDAGLPDSWSAALPALEQRLAVPAGEQAKTLAVYEQVLRRLADWALPRGAELLAVGGGCTTDLAGFVAATYLRGVALRLIPTTLLAMVDAAVGGKTALNLPEGKNLVGAFWPPEAVYIDPLLLSTLPEAAFKDGQVEMFKHGLLDGAAWPGRFFSPEDVASEQLERAITASVTFKAGVVARDPQERSGLRAQLNLGHTLGHALEAWSGHRLSHGQAVALGLHFMALLSEALGGSGVASETAALLRWLRPPLLCPPELAPLLPWMARDKKADLQGLRFTLLRAPGQPYLERVPQGLLASTYAAFLRSSAQLGLV